MSARLRLVERPDPYGRYWEVTANFDCPALMHGVWWEARSDALAWTRSEFGIDVAACLDHDGWAEVAP